MTPQSLINASLLLHLLSFIADEGHRGRWEFREAREEVQQVSALPRLTLSFPHSRLSKAVWALQVGGVDHGMWSG